MTKRDYKVYVKDMLENMESAEQFLRRLSFNKFTKDKKTVYAVVRCIEIIGEAAKHIPDPMRRRYNVIPWRQISGMRDKVIHEYFGVMLEAVWKTVKEEIPRIKPHIKRILSELKDKK